MVLLLSEANYNTLLLSVWCTLSSSYGNAALGFVGFGGLVTIGNLLFAKGLPRAETSIITERNRFNRRRRRTKIVGAAAMIVLLITIVLFAITAHQFRALDASCSVKDAPPLGMFALQLFFCSAILAAILSICFHVMAGNLR